MSTYQTTLKDNNGNELLPKTVLKAIADDNGYYLDSSLSAADINVLKNGMLNNTVRHSNETPGTPSPINAYQLNGHPDTYFGTATDVQANADAISSIIESGTGYIRYSDGTQICYGRLSETGSITTSYASWYSYDLNGSNFAKPFVSTPTLTLSSAYTSDYIYCMPYGVLYSTTGISNIRVLRPTTSGSGVIPVNYIAIGRWK